MAIRSPGYPSINLEEALEKATQMYKHDKRSATSTAVLAGHWNYQPTSSGAKLALAALKKFGLLESVGNKKSGQVKLSELALQIILDQRESSPDRDQAVKRAALNPDLHKELWSKWGYELPSDATVKTYLVMDRGFNDATVGDFLKEYKETISFAKLGPDDKIPEDDSSSTENPETRMSSSNVAPSGVGVGGIGGRAAGVAGRSNVLNLPFPLIGGGMATLSMPIPLSQENFDYLTTMLAATLRGMKKALVVNGPGQGKAATEDEQQEDDD
jgi:hypothetical protein